MLFLTILLEKITKTLQKQAMVQSVIEVFSRMTSNSRKSQKFRPTKYKRYSVIFIRCWKTFACLIFVVVGLHIWMMIYYGMHVSMAYRIAGNIGRNYIGQIAWKWSKIVIGGFNIGGYASWSPVTIVLKETLVDFNLEVFYLNHQSAKFNSLPIFPAIRYVAVQNQAYRMINASKFL